MTDNIEKLYELAEVPKCGCKDKKTGERCSYGSESWYECKKQNMACPKSNWENAKVTLIAEKQIGLIKCITRLKGEFALYFYEYANVWICNTDKKWEMHETYYEHTNFSQALAGLVCELWEDLTPEQREEVRGILE